MASPGSDTRLESLDSGSLERTNRALRMVTRCGEAVLRAATEDELFANVCQVIVDAGGYRMCWAAVPSSEGGPPMRAAAVAGHDDGFLETVRRGWTPGRDGGGPVMRALLQGRPALDTELVGEQADALWYREALQRGYRSCVALPLIHRELRLGALVLYGAEAWRGDDDELAILGSLADTVAFGALSLRERRLREAAEEQQRQSAKALVAERERLAELVQNFPGAILAVVGTGEGRFRMPFASSAIEPLLGLSRQELARDLEPLMARVETPMAAVMARLDRSRREMKPFRGRFAYRHPSRGLREIEGASMPRVTSDGTLLWYGYMADVTERRQAVAAAAESRLRLETLMRTATDAFVAIDGERRIVEADEKFVALVGYPVEELLAMRAEALDPRSTPAMVEDHLRKVMTEGSDRFETCYRRRDGSLVDVEVSVRYLREERGGIFLSFVRDISERKRAADRLAQSERRFRALIEKSTDVIVVIDREGRFRFASPSTTEVLGWSPAELEGKRVEEIGFVHPDDIPPSREIVEALLRGEHETLRLSLRLLHKDGRHRLCEATGRDLLVDPAVGGIVVNLRDMTERRTLEDQLRQSQKLESIGRLAGGVAHDFNNLLTVVLGSAEALTMDLEEGRPVSGELVAEISAAGYRAADLTRQLLAFARKQVIEPRPLDLNAVVAGAEKLLRRVIGEDVQLAVEPYPSLWTIRCDAGQVEQVLVNLAVNARDAMAEGGRLTIATTNVTLGDDAVGRRAELPAGPYVHLRVSDNGCGMTPDVQEHLFEPFFTTKAAGKGTGLGLATVYGIVKQSRGGILVESEPGRGTRFDLYFPRSEGMGEAHEGRASAAPRGGSETVLLVEDDPFVLDVLRRALQGAGYRVLEARDGGEALSVSRDEAGAIDLLVTDVVLPILKGPEVARELRRQRPGLAVLYLSGYLDDGGSAVPTDEHGAEFLRKPCTARQLNDRVRKLLDRRAAVRSPAS